MRPISVLTLAVALAVGAASLAPSRDALAAKPKAAAKAKPKAKADKKRDEAKQDEAGPPSTATPAPTVAPADTKADGTGAPVVVGVTEQPGESGVKTYKFGAQEVEGRLKSPQVAFFLRRVRAEFAAGELGHRSFLLELSHTRHHAALR